MSASKALIISSVHDPRMKRRGSIQAIADTLCRMGFDTTFLSIRFSPISLFKGDLRSSLWREANRYGKAGDLKCYLWRTPFHPFTSSSDLGRKAMEPVHNLYERWPNEDVDAMIKAADLIIVESGLGVALAPRIRRLNKSARLIYRAADTLDTIGAHPHLQALLEQNKDRFDYFCLLGRKMAPQFAWARERTFYVGQALDPHDFEDPGESPYDHDNVAISVGSMLFDADFFEVATALFPELEFIVIGCGQALPARANLTVLPEMKFRDTIPYIAHARVGLAPYRIASSAAYLSESSLKLTQYAHLRLPAVCPHFAVGAFPHRFGYTPGDANEIEHAISGALADDFTEPARTLTWPDAVERMLDPARFPDTVIPEEMFTSGATRSSAAGSAAVVGAWALEARQAGR